MANPITPDEQAKFRRAFPEIPANFTEKGQFLTWLDQNPTVKQNLTKAELHQDPWEFIKPQEQQASPLPTAESGHISDKHKRHTVHGPHDDEKAAPDEDTLLALEADKRYQDIIQQTVAGWNEEHPDQLIQQSFIKDPTGHDVLNPEITGNEKTPGKIPDVRHVAYQVYRDAYGAQAVQAAVHTPHKKAEQDPLYRQLQEKIARNPANKGFYIDEFVEKYPTKAREYASWRKFPRGSKDHKLFQEAFKRKKELAKKNKTQQKDWNREYKRAIKSNPNAVHGAAAQFHAEVGERIASQTADLLTAERLRKAEYDTLFSKYPDKAKRLIRYDKTLKAEYDRWKKEVKKLSKITNVEEDPRFQELLSSRAEQLTKEAIAQKAGEQRQRELAAEDTHGLVVTRRTSHHDIVKSPEAMTAIRKLASENAVGLANDDFVRAHPDLARKYAKKNKTIKAALSAYEADQKREIKASREELYGKQGFGGRIAHMLGINTAPNKLSGIVLDRNGKRVPGVSFTITRGKAGKTLRRGSSKRGGSYTTFLPFGTFTATFSFGGETKTYKVRFWSLTLEPQTVTLVVRLPIETKKEEQPEQTAEEEKTPSEQPNQTEGPASTPLQQPTDTSIEKPHEMPLANQSADVSTEGGIRERIRQRYQQVRSRFFGENSRIGQFRQRLTAPIRSLRTRTSQVAKNIGSAIDRRIGGLGSKLGEGFNKLLPGGGIPKSPEDLAKNLLKQGAKRALAFSPQTWLIIVCIFVELLFMTILLGTAYALFGAPNENVTPTPSVSPPPAPSASPVPSQTPQLTISKTQDKESAKVNDQITYTINLTATGVTGTIDVTDTLTGAVNYVSASPIPQDSDIHKDSKNHLQSVTWHVAAGSGPITLTVKPTTDEYIYDIATATVSSNNTPPGTNNPRTNQPTTPGQTPNTNTDDFTTLMTGQGRNTGILGDEDHFVDTVFKNGANLLSDKTTTEPLVRKIYQTAVQYNINPLIPLTIWGVEASFDPTSATPFGCKPFGSGFDAQITCSVKDVLNYWMKDFEAKYDGTHPVPYGSNNCLYTDPFIYAYEAYTPVCSLNDSNGNARTNFVKYFKQFYNGQ